MWLVVTGASRRSLPPKIRRTFVAEASCRTFHTCSVCHQTVLHVDESMNPRSIPVPCTYCAPFAG
jgi:hypothetical protein